MSEKSSSKVIQIKFSENEDIPIADPSDSTDAISTYLQIRFVVSEILVRGMKVFIVTAYRTDGSLTILST